MRAISDVYRCCCPCRGDRSPDTALSALPLIANSLSSAAPAPSTAHPASKEQAAYRNMRQNLAQAALAALEVLTTCQDVIEQHVPLAQRQLPQCPGVHFNQLEEAVAAQPSSRDMISRRAGPLP